MVLSASDYVPILRCKDAELQALKSLFPKDRQRTMPFIELIPKSFEAPTQGSKAGIVPDPSEVLLEQSKKLLIACQNDEFYVDLLHVDSLPRISGSHVMTELARLSRDLRLAPIPVTGLKRSSEYQAAVSEMIKNDERGLCIRVAAAEVDGPTFARKLATLVKKLKARIPNTDLLVDYGIFDGQGSSLRELLAKLPDLNKWRSLIVASGAFPKDLQQLEPGMRRLSRRDWLHWRMQAIESRVPRRPTFSDYTIQYGEYHEPPKGFCNFSASIRYTLSEDWLVMRGEGVFNEDGPGFPQFRANAILLSEEEEFSGADFSEGDKYIFNMAQSRGDNFGSAMTWLRAGINHHMTFAARQIAAL